MGRSDVGHVVLYYRLIVGKRAVAGYLSECKRQYPLLDTLRGFTLIDNPIDLDIAGAGKRLAVSDGEFSQRLAIGHRLAFVTCGDAGIDPVEDALCIDRILIEHGLCILCILAVLF